MVTTPQTPGEQIAEAIGRILHRGSRSRLYGELTAGLAGGLDEATYPVLSALGRFGPLSAAALGAEIGLDRSVVSRHATRLERGGLLRRQPDPHDARASLLVLTDQGGQAVAELRRRLAARLDGYLEDWPEEHAQVFARLLGRFADEAWAGTGPEPGGEVGRPGPVS